MLFVLFFIATSSLTGGEMRLISCLSFVKKYLDVAFMAAPKYDSNSSLVVLEIPAASQE